MEVDLVVSSTVSGEDTFEADNCNDTAHFEGETCGICMDIVVDRGVLDCCQHWFCFACIDNWSTITNLCPLCQSEFQSITCVPVYDTIGSNNFEEEAFSREDEWCIEEKNNTLSFPSYYIDENAVVCLDGDGCRVRSGSASSVGDSYLDTSIACDSCDLWYHAYCVGFDPEATTEETWLCPRCMEHRLLKESNLMPPESHGNYHSQNHGIMGRQVQGSFHGKVSISVADAGETAIVVSMVPDSHSTELPGREPSSTTAIGKGLKTESFLLSSDSIGQTLHNKLLEISNIQTKLEAQDLELSLSKDTSFNLSSSAFGELKALATNDATIGQVIVNGSQSSLRKFCSQTPNYKMSKNESGIDLHLGLATGTLPSVEDARSNTEVEMTSEDAIKQTISENLGHKIITKVENQISSKINGTKRRCASSSIDINENTGSVKTGEKIENGAPEKKSRIEKRNGEIKPKIETPVSRRKSKPECRVEVSPHNNQANHEDIHKIHNSGHGDDCLKDDREMSSDIMSIVKGTGRRLSKVHEGQSPADEASTVENASRVRVKKIMRRPVEDKESSIVVQNLRKEIREAIRKRASEDSGENLFDPKLLAAFRAVVSVPKTDPPKKLSPLAVRTKKALLQKGKVRESLTKKIYGTSNGRRKRAWDRECDVEFWKYRCMGATKPEKIQTLKSVLGLLRKGPENSKIKHDLDQQSSSSFYSRLYLADTSVLPRKDDIKPLSAVDSGNNSEPRKGPMPPRNNDKHIFNEGSMKSAGMAVHASNLGSSGLQVNKEIASSLKHDASVRKTPPIKHGEGTAIPSGGSSGDRKEITAQSDDSRSDKRKWALQVLARKTASAVKSSSQDVCEDNAILKGKYPLLAQLPAEMRPKLAPARQNKIPQSVRQTQLYRLTEHFLKKANLEAICRTAETELAVADAINIEKEVAGRANSKIVYLNLCSQELLHHADNKCPEVTEPTPPNTSEKREQCASESSDPDVAAALRAAGLLSDSPPDSPNTAPAVSDVCDDPPTNSKDGPENVFEMESNAELDIYGDFEYDLGDEDYIGTSAVSLSERLPEEGEPKMKVIFSTFNSESVNKTTDSKDHVAAETVVNSESLAMFSIPNETNSKTLPVEDKTADSHKFSKADEEPSMAECEELYGPDKEPLLDKFPEGISGVQHNLANVEAQNVNDGAGGNGQLAEVANDHASSHEKRSSDPQIDNNEQEVEKRRDPDASQQCDGADSIPKKVEAYIKEHIRPLCKSGVISAEQYRWAVAKTVDKVMKYHQKAKNANFLIKEGEKVKKLALQYVEASQQKGKSDPKP